MLLSDAKAELQRGDKTLHTSVETIEKVVFAGSIIVGYALAFFALVYPVYMYVWG